MRGTDETAEEARRLANERAFNPERFLALLDRGGYSKSEIDDLRAEQRSSLLPALRAMVVERSGIVRLNVAVALLQLGDPSGSETIVECLMGEDRDLRRAALDRLMTWLPHDHEKGGYKAPIDADAVLAALERSLAGADRLRREQAVYILNRLETPRAFDRLTGLLGDARPDMRAEAAIWLGRSGQDRGALLVIEEMLAVPAYPKRYHLVAAVEKLCKSADADISSRAAAVARRFIRRNLANRSASSDDANFAANDIWHCLDGIAAAGASDEQDILREVLASKVDTLARGIALKRLAQLEGHSGVVRLLDALSDAELRSYALEGLSSVARGSSDPAVIEALAQEIAREDASNLTEFVEAFLAVGGRAGELLDRVASQVDRDTAMTIHWLRTDIGPKDVIDRLQHACGGVALSIEKIGEFEAKWREKPDARNILYTLLAEWNRIAVVFRKTVVSPVDHAEVIRKLTAISQDRFALDEVVQTIEPGGDLRVLLVHRGAGYSLLLENRGRWCNADGVLAGLNGILKSLGLAERFIELYAGARDVAVVAFVRADEFRTAAGELGISLEPTL
jgi:HEAT repeat protein